MAGMTRESRAPQDNSIMASLALLLQQLLSKTDQVLDKLRIITTQLADVTGSDVTEKDIGDVD